MILYAIFFIPFAAAVAAYVLPSDRFRPWILPVVGWGHLSCVLIALNVPPETVHGWFFLDPIGKLVLLVVGVLFFVCFLYAPAYLRIRRERGNRIFCCCVLLLLAFLSLITFSQQLGFMWVAMEATTLVSAPLIYFNHNSRSIEAAWKYLLVCSVGIALALLGSFFLAYSTLAAVNPPALLMEDLVRAAGNLSKPWLHVAFATLVVGYGTKMGLAPLHTWKPDAYGESPGLVGALLAGGVTSCAFLAILRFTRILHAAGEGAFADRTLVGMGLLSMTFGAIFMVRQKDFKRMLAYSSVEHMGILVLGIGLGGIGIFGSFLHLLNNAFTKGVLFLASGNIHRAYKSKLTDEVSGALKRLPVSGWLFLVGFIAVIGTPPFGPFVSEFAILRGALEGGRFVVGGLYLFLLMVVFMGMGRTVLDVCQGEPTAAAEATGFQDTFFLTVPPLLLLGLVLWIGINIPQPLMNIIQDAVEYWRGAA
jgi:hydrogenase-4 component F